MSFWKVFALELLTGMFRLFVKPFRPVGRILSRAFYLSRLRTGKQAIVPVSTQFDGPVHLVGTGKIMLGEHCRLGRNVLFETNGGGEIILGNRVRINDGSILSAHAGIYVGDDSLIGEYVSIRDANHGTKATELVRTQAHICASIKIGCDVWIGRGCCVLKGISIGDGAVIGANSVLTKDVPAGSVWAGVPAAPIGIRGAEK